MPELAQIETKKTVGFVDRGSNYQRKQDRLKKEEEEIKKLEAEQLGESEEEQSTEKKETSKENK